MTRMRIALLALPALALADGLGRHEVFADGFATVQNPQPQTAVHRPTGLAIGPDGSLYVSDDVGGRIWRIRYVGTGGV